ncbi:hypothetical protein GCM10009749_25160 [Agromyces neolithicus]|uniref:Uncharacterized protein n=1 Tax=Agromyces neolithicus TaxID=269420 RepID=A0ABN2MA34_9MICO
MAPVSAGVAASAVGSALRPTSSNKLGETLIAVPRPPKIRVLHGFARALLRGVWCAAGVHRRTPGLERRCAMLATMLLLGLLAATAVTSALVQFGRDGYRRTPTV